MTKQSFRVTCDICIPPNEILPDASFVLCQNLVFLIYSHPDEIQSRVDAMFPRFEVCIMDCEPVRSEF